MPVDNLDEISALRAVAVLTEQLKIAGSVRPAHRERDDVVELKPFARAAANARASVALPDKRFDLIGYWLASTVVAQLLDVFH